jgi:pimeloyl-ACP methyl ester carboxylesterase
MGVIICPGVHSPELTQGFLAGLGKPLRPLCIFPAEQFPAYSVLHILKFLDQQDLDRRLLLIGFSAGVVGAVGAAQVLHRAGRVKALIAIDGWGVPLWSQFPWGDFPTHRLSHDRFTHDSSRLLDQPSLRDKSTYFYAEPSVPHLDLWRSPQTVSGWTNQENASTARLGGRGHKQYATTAAQFLQNLMIRYSELETT